MSTWKQPPKKVQAASQPAITAVRVWEWVSHTNMCRLRTAVKISTCTARFFPVTGSRSSPSRAKSIWHSTPGSPSATRTVGRLDPERAALDREPVQRAVRHPHALTGEQLLDLHDRQLVLLLPVDNSAAHPGSDLLLMGEQDLPARAVPVRAGRTHRLHDGADELVVDRLRAGPADQALGLGRLDVRPDWPKPPTPPPRQDSSD